MTTYDRQESAIVNLLILAAIVIACVLASRRRSLSKTAFGTAFWMPDKWLARWGLLGRTGLVLGRALSGGLLRLNRYTHVLLIGGTGSGKGIGLIIPNLIDYARGSVIVFDTKGDLFATTVRHRRRLGRVIRLSPFGEGGDRWNPLDTIPRGPLMIDRARALAESLVVRPPTGGDEPHWDDKAVQVITAILVLVLTRFPDAERSLNSVQDVASDPLMLFAAADELQKLRGIPARMGSQLKALFDKDRFLTKEGAGVISTVGRHLSFLDSEAVATSVANSTFDVRELLPPGRATLFLHIPPAQLDAQRGLLRCWVSTLIREIGDQGTENLGEVLMLLDEASALGSLSALEECLTRGRSSGIRMLLAYQSDAQVTTAFRGKPSLIYDNCATQIYLGATSIETAERVSKMLGSWTQAVESFGENSTHSHSPGATGGDQTSWGRSANYAVQGRPLLYPDEVLRLSSEFLIVFHGGLPAPVLARRIRWYADPAFNPAAKPARRPARGDRILLAVCIAVFLGLIVRAKVNGYGYFAPDSLVVLPSEPKRGVSNPKQKPQSKGAEPWPKSAKGR